MFVLFIYLYSVTFGLELFNFHSIELNPLPHLYQAELTELVQTYKQEVTEAACELICDWAQKILKRSFDTVVEIARYLIQEHIVNPRCSQAELVTSAALAGLTESQSVCFILFIQAFWGNWGGR